MRPSGTPAELQRRRERAMALFEQGFQPVDIAERVGADRRSVRRWKAAYGRLGPQGIEAKPAPGRPPKLGPKALKKLERLLLRGARDAGFSTDLWTCRRVGRLIEKQFNVRYHVDHVGRLLHRLGWSAQKPQRRAQERDEEQIQTWIKQQWPRIKKKPRD